MARVMPAAGVLLLAAVLFLALVWVLQRRLIYLPSGELPPLAEVGLAGATAIAYESDGLRLGAWFVPAEGTKRLPAVLVFSGNAGNRGHRAPLASALRKHGFHVLLTDYRGYGGNPGAASETALHTDALAAWSYLRSRADVNPTQIVYFGESLGTGVAVALAVEHPPPALILRSPFTSLTDIGRAHYPFLPVRLLLRDRFPSIERIGRVRAPVLVIAGERDTIIPVSSSRRLYEAANDPKTLVVLPHADHNDYDLLAGNDMISAIVRFLEPVLNP